MLKLWAILIVIVGCVGCAGGPSSPPVWLPEYLDQLYQQAIYRDELATLRNFVSHKRGRPFVISVLADKEGKAALGVDLKISQASKTTGGIEASAVPMFGVKLSSESSTGSESTLKLSLILLDPGKYASLYAEVRKEFDRYPLGDLADEIPDTGWDDYCKTHSTFGPAIWFEDRYYAVPKEKKEKFYALVDAVRRMDAEGKTAKK